MLGASGTDPSQLVVWGPKEAMADEMLHHTMAWGTMGYHFPKYNVQLVNPYDFNVSATGYAADAGRPNNAGLSGLGCCDWCSDDRLGDYLGTAEFAGTGAWSGLGDCPGGPTVIVESTPIPIWVWLIVAGWAALMLLKK